MLGLPQLQTDSGLRFVGHRQGSENCESLAGILSKAPTIHFRTLPRIGIVYPPIHPQILSLSQIVMHWEGFPVNYLLRRF